MNKSRTMKYRHTAPNNEAVQCCTCTAPVTKKIQTYVVEVPEELTSYIESLNFEVEARRSLINYCMGHGINPENPVFQRYHDEYVDFFIQYEEAKAEITDKYVKNDYPNSNWVLDFGTSTLTITVEE